MSRESMLKLSQILQEATAEPEMKIASISDQKKALADYLEFSEPGRFKVGDFVTTNSLGRAKYKFPMNGQVARIVEIFETSQQDKEGDLETGAIAVAIQGEKGNCVARYTVNLAFYEVIEEPNDVSDQGVAGS